MELSCYIVDDEPHAIAMLAGYIERTTGLVLAGKTSDPFKAIEQISVIKPRLTFADVDMPELSGLELAEKVKGSTAIVFSTSFREYAPEAFEQEAFDYLLKPFSYERFLKCVERYRSRYGPIQATTEFDEHILVRSGNRGNFAKITTSSIIHINGLLNYVEIYMADRKVITHSTMEEMLSRLPRERFSRVHKSHIINHEYITALNYGQVTLESCGKFPIGRAYRKQFLQKMTGRQLLFKANNSKS